jgi:hypothetical protein
MMLTTTAMVMMRLLMEKNFKLSGTRRGGLNDEIEFADSFIFSLKKNHRDWPKYVDFLMG